MCSVTICLPTVCKIVANHLGAFCGESFYVVYYLGAFCGESFYVVSGPTCTLVGPVKCHEYD